MKERPILFSGPMVRAILDGRKTVTRRVMRTNHVGYRAFYRWDGEPFRRAMMRCLNETEPGSSVFCEDNRIGVPGDRLWVRETHAIVPASAYWHDSTIPHRVHADEHGDPWWSVYREGWERSAPSRWRPSIHMPWWASRITLVVVDVRVERLHEINEEDARAEGIERLGGGWRDYLRDGEAYVTGVGSFASLWESINDPGSWVANPWVWRVEFRRLSDGGAA